MSEIHFPLEENEDKARYKVARPQIDDQRIWASVINAADHFLGCDSMGQHIARAFDKTATIVTGSTCPVNISYPDHKDFDVIDVGEGRRIYSPIRISIDEVRDRLNDEAMEMTKEQMNSVVASVKKRMGKSTAYTGDFVPQAQDYGSSCCPPSTCSMKFMMSSTQVNDLRMLMRICIPINQSQLSCHTSVHVVTSKINCSRLTQRL